MWLLIRKDKNPLQTKLSATVSRISASDTTLRNQDLYYLQHPYLARGDAFNDAGDYDSAIYYYKQASQKFEQEKQWENYTWINGYIGRLYLYVAGKNYKDALPYLENALQKGKQYLRADHPYLAIAYYYWGLYDYNNKLPGKSLADLQLALDLISKGYGAGNIYTADIYNAIGNVYANLLFDNAKAETNFLQSIHIKEILPGGEKKSSLTSGYYNLVNLSFSIDDIEKAQFYCYQAIANARYIKSHQSYWLELLEGAQANIYKEQRAFGKAIGRLQNAISINNTNNGDKSYLSFYYTSLGDIHRRLGSYDSAIVFYEKALQLQHLPTLFYNQQKQAATAYYGLGITYFFLRNYPRALHYTSQCLETRLKEYGPKHNETARAFQQMGAIFQGTGLQDSALKYYQAGLLACTRSFNSENIKGVPIAANINNSLAAFEIVRARASLLKDLYKQGADSNLLSTSLAYYQLADTLISLFGTEYKRENAKLAFSTNNNDVYEEAIDCVTLLYQLTGQKKYPALVFDFMDKRKSNLLLEAVNEKQVLQQAGISLSEQDTLKHLQQEQAFLQSQLQTENNKNALNESALQAVHNRANMVESGLNNLYEQLRKKYPYYASVYRQADSIDLKDLQAYADRNNKLVLEYFWGEKAVYLLAVGKASSQLVKIDRNPGLDNHIDTLRSHLAKGYVFDTRKTDFASFERSSFFAYNTLLKPVLSAFSRSAENTQKPGIVAIPDGPLYYLPLEMMISRVDSLHNTDYRQLHYLLRDYTISYDYSTRLLLQKNKRSPYNGDPRILALGFSKEVPNGQATDNKGLHELPGAAKELKSISQFIKGQFYTGNDATEEVFKKLAPHYDVLHLAVHGEADSLNSYNSRLIFKKENDSLNDGDLYAYELYGLPIKARLAVLSACESGIGKLYAGEGMYSIARGFLYAGCPSVVMSYWRVGDDATQSIISNFYRQLAAGNAIDGSLQKTKITYLENADQRTAHPANWAAFVAIGDMAPLVKKDPWRLPMLIIATVILVGLVIYLARKYFGPVTIRNIPKTVRQKL